MKKILTLLFLSMLTGITTSYAITKGSKPKTKDTLSIKCLLFSPNLFYGIELGEKPVRDMVDTLVGQINMYDTAKELDLVILSGRDLGFSNQQNILWQQILDSATTRGYGVCPPQAGPEIYVLSQNMKQGHALLARRAAEGKPIFVGMNKLRFSGNTNNKSGIFGSEKHSFDYVFCIKSGRQKNSYDLGYCATGAVKGRTKYVWTSNDLFIFVNKNQRPTNSHVMRYCISGASVGE